MSGAEPLHAVREQDGAHLDECTDTDCAEDCPVQAERDAEYAAGHEWHG